MSVNLFGRSYQSVGDSSSDYLIKTKGQVKVLYGSKFIDLIKDGKLNVDAKFIYLQDEVGSKDGIYVVGDKAILVSSGKQIDLIGEVGNSYVSFLEKQETTPEQKYIALQNIGFIYTTLKDAQDSIPLNGIVYIEENNKLYIIKNGLILEYTVSLPSIINKQFVILKEDPLQGALLIKGEGKENSVSFDLLYIYNKNNSLYLSSLNQFVFEINGQNKVVISEDNITFSNGIVANNFSTTGATEQNGLRVYTINGETTLEVDKLVVRNEALLNLDIQPTKYILNNNIINYTIYTDSVFNVTFYFENTFSVGDTIGWYRLASGTSNYEYLLITFKVTQILDGTVSLLKLDNIEISSDELVNQTLFLISSEEGKLIIKESSEGIDIIDNNEVVTRVGLLETKKGIYSKNGLFDNLEINTKLDTQDISNKVPTTEWVNNLLPKGSIILFNSKLEIPENWLLCDGTNGTPNLSLNFISDENEIICVYIMKNY